MEKRLFEKENSLNGWCANCTLSQQRGSPQFTVPDTVPTPRTEWLLPVVTYKGGNPKYSRYLACQ
jgi:hypothetical protein